MRNKRKRSSQLMWIYLFVNVLRFAVWQFEFSELCVSGTVCSEERFRQSLFSFSLPARCQLMFVASFFSLFRIRTLRSRSLALFSQLLQSLLPFEGVLDSFSHELITLDVTGFGGCRFRLVPRLHHSLVRSNYPAA